MINIKLKQYAKLMDASEYDAILDKLKPKNSIRTYKFRFIPVIRTMSINKMPYVNVKYCIRMLSKTTGWDEIRDLFEVCYDINQKQFWSMSIIEFFQAKNYLIAEFKRIVETEAKMLAGQSTDEHLWQMAGADRLKPYNDTLPLVQLGKLFSQYPFDLGRKPYGEVLNLLVQVKVQNEVESEYQKLKSK